MTLKPCRDCGAPCQVETIDNGPFVGNIWMCSHSARFRNGGTCEGDLYLTEEAWNDRPEERNITVDCDRLTAIVEKLADMQDHRNAANQCLMEATMMLRDIVSHGT